tara:strand:- start:2005 stop:2790 length:786 start_codon:yes stop_codon:yes gene_type:complete
MYYLYHIPGKKIGVTRNLNTRVTLIQGYKEGEYEVLEQSEDIDYISDREIELQKSYGYKVDLKKYKNLNHNFNKMNINFTEQTSTFPCPVNKLKGRLQDNIGLSWETDHGVFTVTKETIPWLVKNAKVSMFNVEKCYIYNKSFREEVYESTSSKKDYLEESIDPSIFDMIRVWAKDRGIYEKGNSQIQFIKLMEEAGELAQALLKQDKPEVIDAIGDMVVVLTNLAHLEGYKIENCIDSAYKEIQYRKGKMTRGTFVKETL